MEDKMADTDTDQGKGKDVPLTVRIEFGVDQHLIVARGKRQGCQCT